MEKIKTGKYQHYKGSYYKVLGTVTHSESLEELVLYQKLYDDYSMWVRPLEMFKEQVEQKGQLIQRFKFIEEA